MKFKLIILFFLFISHSSCTKDSNIYWEYMVVPYPITGSILIHNQPSNFENGLKIRNGKGYKFELYEENSNFRIIVTTPYEPKTLFFDHYNDEQNWIQINEGQFELNGHTEKLLPPREKYWTIKIGF